MVCLLHILILKGMIHLLLVLRFLIFEALAVLIEVLYETLGLLKDLQIVFDGSSKDLSGPTGLLKDLQRVFEGPVVQGPFWTLRTPKRLGPRRVLSGPS